MADADSGGPTRSVGGRVAAGIAGHLVRANIATRVAMKGHVVDTVMQAQEHFFRLTGSELRRSAGPILSEIAKDGALPDIVKPLVSFMAKGEGQFASMLGMSAIGQAMGVGLGGLLTNALQPVVGRINATGPALPISPEAAARAEVTDQAHGLDTAYEAAQQGIDGRKFEILKSLVTPKLDPSTLIDMVNRGEMSELDAVGRLRLLGFSNENAYAILSTRRTLIPPAALADLVTFGAITEHDATAKAQQAGITADDFDLMVRGNGQPPSTEELLFAYRRGVINKDRLFKGITQGPLRNEWFDVVESLGIVPMSTADAIEAAVQGHISLDQSRTIARQNGLMPEHWQPLYDTAGNPPGVQEMVSMWHRGQLTKAQLVQGISESRLKNKYIQAVIDASETLPPERSIISLVTKGALTQQAGYDLLLKRGYSPDIATALMSEAGNTKNQKTRELTESQIVALYEDQAINRDTAIGMVTTLGYTADETDMLLTLADLRRIRKYTDAAIAKVRSAYVSRRVDENGAATTLDALRVPPDQRDSLLQLWNLERAVSTKELTLAQAHAALKAGIIDINDFGNRLLGMGYAEPDAAILVALYTPPPA